MSGVVLVTGGSRGIGAAIARGAAADFEGVAITYASNSEAADATRSGIEATGVACCAVRKGAGSSEEAEALLDTVESALGPVTALVNNAGVTGPISPFTKVSFRTMQEVVAVNLIAPMLLSQAIIRRWRERQIGGRIVNISSVAARLGAPGEYIPYAAAKAGIETFTRGLAKEVAPLGIRVNAVAPGTTMTGIHAAAGEPDRPARVARKIPMGRVGEPEEIANAVLWLLSDEASFVTGETITVAGGL